MSEQIQTLLKDSKPIVPVIALPNLDCALPLADTLAECGFKVLEITLRTECALEAIKLLRDNRPDLRVGAGTVKSVSQLDQAIAAGSQFIVSPGTHADMIQKAQSQRIPLIPGVMTPSEIMTAENLGLSTVKLFPASLAGGVDFLKAMASVFANMSFFPTGGISEDTVDEFLSLTNVVCVGGSWLSPKELMLQGQWDRIREIAQRC